MVTSGGGVKRVSDCICSGWGSLRVAIPTDSRSISPSRMGGSEMATGAARLTPRTRTKAKAAAKASKRSQKSLRIRMYRVGFGDFFLVTAWSKDGPQHILIDCGVTPGKTGKGDIASIKTAVRHMAEETRNRLALIIMTHRHQDHIIGFSRCEAEFEKFSGHVDAIWMPYWETEYPKVQKFQADLENLALGLQAAALAGDRDATSEEILGTVENLTGHSKEAPARGT